MPLRLARLACALFTLAGCSTERGPAPVLLFAGTGSSPNDVRALEGLLGEKRIAFERVESAELDRMSDEQLRSHRLLIVPGGNFEQMGNALQPATSVKVRNAVHAGLNYLGICAGAFIAGDSPYNGFNLTGVRFPFYSAESRGVRKAAVTIRSPDGSTLEHYWEDGPQLDGWGEVVGKYPDDTPAIAQGMVGRGWVVLTGTHPEAPEQWREGMTFVTPVGATRSYAGALIDAALQANALPHFDR
jgi:glutamine amidotransferase-like uncharacterized protein